MPTWSGIQTEYSQLFEQYQAQAVDVLRRKYIAKVSQITGKDTILYASRFVQGDLLGDEQHLLMITDDDIQAFMEVIHGLKGTKLNIILHSPGGIPEAAEAVVSYVRQKFTDVTVYVPTLAMSAATMLACSANQICLGKHSFLGPIDPQLRIQTPLGIQFAPAQAILDQFSRAKKECGAPKNLAAWMPMLGQYGPHLLETCENVLKLSEEMVGKWLQEYMLEGKSARKAKSIARWLRDHKHHKSHNRHISRSEAESKGMKIIKLESDQNLQDAILSVFHATVLTFNLTAAAKITENQIGRAFIKFSPSIMARFENLMRQAMREQEESAAGAGKARHVKTDPLTVI